MKVAIGCDEVAIDLKDSFIEILKVYVFLFSRFKLYNSLTGWLEAKSLIRSVLEFKLYNSLTGRA
ncbi:MAG: hypothetical protein JW770_06905 [Actinobacteria bacterium]|nr:hypothetical protein [Actinomycetota bacterium]